MKNYAFGIAPRTFLKIYKLTNQGTIVNDYGLKDQMRRAAVSIVSNTAEGDEPGTDKLSTRYFYHED
ncbi:MAG TPA: four helix bundle protein [Bacteroidales bacterium]|nr:four helix bundle protein [Bacteroidales bacterium]